MHVKRGQKTPTFGRKRMRWRKKTQKIGSKTAIFCQYFLLFRCYFIDLRKEKQNNIVLFCYTKLSSQAKNDKLFCFSTALHYLCRQVARANIIYYT